MPRRLSTKAFRPVVKQDVIDEEWAASNQRPQTENWACHSFPDLEDLLGSEDVVDERMSPLVAEIDRFLHHDASEAAKAGAPTVAVGWERVAKEAYPELEEYGIREVLLLLALRTLRNRDSEAARCQSGDVIESCAGVGLLTFAHIQFGLRASRIDAAYTSQHDASSPAGFRLWLDELSTSAYGALTWIASQCSSFSGVCRKQSQRRAENRYEGDTTRRFVRDGNELTLKSALVLFLAFLTKASPVLEQPVCSVMPLTQSMATVLSFCRATRSVTWLCAFGALSAKPLQLFHVGPCYATLRRKRPKNMSLDPLTSTSGAKDPLTGRKRFSGKKANMQASQVYPYAFGLAVARLSWARLRRT